MNRVQAQQILDEYSKTAGFDNWNALKVWCIANDNQSGLQNHIENAIIYFHDKERK